MSQCPLVQCPMGKVSGRCCVKPNKANAKQVYRFAKIPFAKPPVGDLRFEPPQKAEPWNGVLDGTKRGPAPMQPEELGKPLEKCMTIPDEFEETFEEFSEDCLYLDVYTSNPNLSAQMPVLFWIYGGGFQIGGSMLYNGNVLASLHDVVVVIPNYRVSAYGFLSFDGNDSPCSGNMGLMDQAMALEWVRDNVKSFGGDPKNVTIFGESAGSISVSLHLKSPMTKSLYHKAISHSGVSDFPMIVSDSNNIAVQRLLKELKIEDEDQQIQFQKLKKMPVEKLNKVLNATVKELVFFAVMKQDGKFFPEKPEVVMKNNTFSKVPYMVGVNNTEGCGLLAPGREQGFMEGLKKEQAQEILKGMASMMAPPEKSDELQAAIIQEYGKGIGNKNDKMYWSKLLGYMSGETAFMVNSIKAVNEYSDKNVPTYFYYMTQPIGYNHDSTFNPKGEALYKSDICECDHGDDLHFTFGIPLSNAKLTLDVKFSEDEMKMSELWMNYIVNFATTGDPNKGPNKIAVKWSKYDSKTRNYLEANAFPKIKQNLKAERYKFWTEVVEAIIKN